LAEKSQLLPARTEQFAAASWVLRVNALAVR
jgi:hypothetical protein